MINLFEYQNKVNSNPSLDGLEDFLDDIWESRAKNSFYLDEENESSQKFLRFIGKTNEIKSNNKFWEKILSFFDHIFIQDEASEKLLNGIGITQNVTISGDTRFDRVLEIASKKSAIKIPSFGG